MCAALIMSRSSTSSQRRLEPARLILPGVVSHRSTFTRVTAPTLRPALGKIERRSRVSDLITVLALFFSLLFFHISFRQRVAVGCEHIDILIVKALGVETLFHLRTMLWCVLAFVHLFSLCLPLGV